MSVREALFAVAYELRYNHVLMGDVSPVLKHGGGFMKLSVLCLLAAAACLSACGGAKSEALDVYRQFSAAYREGNCDVLLTLVEAKAQEDAVKFCTSPGKFFGKALPSAASIAYDMHDKQPMMGGWKTELESYSESGEDLVLEVVQKPVGRLARKSTFNTPPQPRHKTVTMSKASGSWKVKEEVKKS